MNENTCPSGHVLNAQGVCERDGYVKPTEESVAEDTVLDTPAEETVPETPEQEPESETPDSGEQIPGEPTEETEDSETTPAAEATV